MGPQDMPLRLKKPLERVIGQGHPWLYRDAVGGATGQPGEVVDVLDRRGRFLARGFVDAPPLAARLLTTLDEPLDAALFGRRLRQAASLRDRVVPPHTDAYRLVHGEGDRLPAVVVDVYGAHAVLQLDGTGIAAWREVLLPPLLDVLALRGVRCVHERRGRRGERTLLTLAGEPPSGAVHVREHGMVLVADLEHGQKTGLFLDHRETRRLVRGLVQGGRVLNLYGYTGAFSVAAGLGGATAVQTVDAAAPALELARASWAANELTAGAHSTVAADAQEHLEALARQGATFDLVIADPPSFAPREAAVERALAAYRALHRACLSLLAPGGLYLAASCSSHVDRLAFDQTLRDGAHAARRPAQVLWRGGAAPDHPHLAVFPEGDYLKATLLRV
jgi:23S rRNA (cytosine1962-C5)-methyltransferase